jgi:hypothetical protein
MLEILPVTEETAELNSDDFKDVSELCSDESEENRELSEDAAADD